MQSPLPTQIVRHDERISKLERDLAKLEIIVEQLVTGMEAEHRVMRESRQEDRAALKELGEKMERSVAALAEEMKRLADRNAAIDANVLAKQSQALGALAVARWIIATAIGAGALFLTFQAGTRKEHYPPQEGYYAPREQRPPGVTP